MLHTHEHIGHRDVHDRGPEGAQLVGDLIVPEHIDLLALEIGEAGDGLLAADEHTDGQGVGEQDLDPVQLFLDFGEGVLHFQYPRRGIFKGHARTDQGEDALVEGELPHGHVIAEFGHVRDAVLDGFESVGFLAEGFREIGFDADTPVAALVQLFGPLLEGEVPAVMDRRDGQVEAQDILFSRAAFGGRHPGGEKHRSHDQNQKALHRNSRDGARLNPGFRLSGGESRGLSLQERMQGEPERDARAGTGQAAAAQCQHSSG